MSLETIRVALTTAIEALRPSFSGGYTLVVEYDNVLLVDTKTQVNPFLCVEIKFLDGEPTDLSSSMQRVYGMLVLSAVVPEGSGSSKAYKLLDHFAVGLQNKTFGSVRTKVSSPSAQKPHLGWLYFTVGVPFWTDQPV